jgi:hypothetical protein
MRRCHSGISLAAPRILHTYLVCKFQKKTLFTFKIGPLACTLVQYTVKKIDASVSYTLEKNGGCLVIFIYRK